MGQSDFVCLVWFHFVDSDFFGVPDNLGILFHRDKFVELCVYDVRVRFGGRDV